jgi:CRISPR-associated protein Cmr4
MSNDNAGDGGSLASAAVLFLFAETPLHAGTGAVKAAVDLPIQRSVQTRWPIIHDSSMRGSLRDEVREVAGEGRADELFGYESVGEGDSERPSGPGKLITPDAELLLFPVASARNMTAWVTCVPALQYFERRVQVFSRQLGEKAQQAAAEFSRALAALSQPGPREAVVAGDAAVLWEGNKVILCSDSFTVKDASANALGQWLGKYAVPFGKFWQDRVSKHLVVLDQGAFEHYVLSKTDIRPRVKLSGGHVQPGALWTEENLPVDSVLYQTIGLRRGAKASDFVNFVKTLKLDTKPVIQLGGDQSLGRGFVRLRQLGD